MPEMPAESTEDRRRRDAGCYVLEERIAEAYEPDWRDLIDRMFFAMRDADLTVDRKKPWEEDDE